MHYRIVYLIALLSSIGSSPATGQNEPLGKIVTEHIKSSLLRENRIALDTNRSVMVYLPPGYESSDRRYPVVYYCHTTFSNPAKLFEESDIAKLLDQRFAADHAGEFILVVGDYSTPTTGSVYENSPVSGRWLDFTVQELVPFIDRQFRTLAQPDSRAVVGHFLGGRGALKLAMAYPDLFGVVYAMHPVATGVGRIPWSSLAIDWEKIHRAKSLADLGDDVRTRLFVTISQAFLPNLDRPPFYCDFFMEMSEDALTLNAESLRKTQQGFHIEEGLDTSLDNLRLLRGIAFDWGRFDPVQDHVYANQAFSQKLESLGIEHEAEEYRGDPWNRIWTANGRFYTRVLPFLARHLVFEAQL